MTEEKEETIDFAGILTGLLTRNNGAPYIGVSMGDEKLAMTPDQALVLFDQLGGLLEYLGLLDDDEPKGATCRVH